MKKKFVGTLGLIIGLLLLPLVAYSDIITFDLNSPNTALAPYTGPYASITVNLNSAGQATITETALNGCGIVDGGSLGLNVNGPYSLASYTGIIASTKSSDINWKTPDQSNSNVDGLGKYDLIFSQQNSNTPLSSLTVVLDGSWASASQVLALESGKGQNYVAAGHLLPPNSDGITGYAAAAPVPIPAAVWLFGSGLLGLVGFKRRIS